VEYCVMVRGFRGGKWRYTTNAYTFVMPDHNQEAFLSEVRKLEGEYFLGDIGTGKEVLKVEPLKQPSGKAFYVETTYPTGRQEVGPVDVKIDISPRLGEMVADVMREKGPKSLVEYAAEDLGLAKEQMKGFGFKQINKKWYGAITIPTSPREKFRSLGPNAEGHCPKCGRKLVQRELFNKHYMGCPECDK